MTQPAKSQEPSMEEILASIRRIIADDDATKGQAADAPKAAAPAAARPAASPPPRPPALQRPASPAPAAAPPREPAALASVESRRFEPAANASGQRDHADILDLTESMAAPRAPEPAPAFRTIDGQPDVIFSDEPERPASGHAEEFRRPAALRSEELLSSRTSAAVDSAFSTLAQSVMVQNARTIDDIVREMLRPMLKSWLDDNLPALVERLVRAEIERVSRAHPT